MSATSYELSPAELAEWERRTSPDRPHAEVFVDEAWQDPLWRICNIYSALTPDSDVVHFTPSPEQRVVIWCIWVLGWQRVIIPKARQLGMSLVLCLMALDQLIFEAGFQGALIDKTQPDAAKKMEEKVRFGWRNLIAEVRSSLKVTADNDSEFTVESVVKIGDDVAPSSFQCGVTFRGGTVKWLHISEWGKIQNDPETRKKSVEIATGAMEAVEKAEDGVCAVETTWEGGLDGEVGVLAQEALNIPDAQKGPKSWRILFFGWQTDPANTTEFGYIDAASAEYFRKIEAVGVHLTDGQKRWYAAKRRTLGDAKVKQEQPTIVTECWEQSPAGSIYGKWIEEARAEGRITHFSWPRDYPVHTFADIGHPLNTVQIAVQMTPLQIRVVDVLMEVDMTIEQRAAWWRQQGYDFGTHFWPWDADTDKDSIGAKPIDTYRRVFGPQCQVVPRCHSVWDGISAMRTHFSRLVFCCDSTAKDTLTAGGRVKQLLEFLGRFRAERETSTGIAKDVPVHDRYSHCASALAQLGLTILGGRIPHANSVGSREPYERPQLRVISAGAYH